MKKDSKHVSNEMKMRLVKITAELFSKELTDDEFSYWRQLLSAYPQKAVEYAFENWQRNGKFFPKPSQILELIVVWREGQPKQYFVACGKDGCNDGWKLVTSGMTLGWMEKVYPSETENKFELGRQSPIDPVGGAVVRCQCWHDFVNGVSFSSKPPMSIGGGYGQNDVRLLYKLFQAQRTALNRPLTESEYEDLLNELDRKTGRTA